MKKLDFPLIADCLFYSVCVGALSLCILRYFLVPFGLSVFSAILFALAAGGISFLILYGKHRKRYLGKKLTEEKNALLLHLALERPERVRAQLLTALCADGRDAHCEKDELNLDGIPAVPLFTMQPVSADEIARLIRSFGEAPFCIFCNALTPESEKLLSSFGILATNGEEVFDLFQRTDCIPQKLICGEIPRKTVKTKLRRSFSKKNARPFFASGLVLLVMSLFTVFPVYYLITGGILILSAVAVRIFGFA